jgi:hypothetical protein
MGDEVGGSNHVHILLGDGRLRVSDMSVVEMIRPREPGTVELVIRGSPKREKILNMSKKDSPSP